MADLWTKDPTSGIYLADASSIRRNPNRVACPVDGSPVRDWRQERRGGSTSLAVEILAWTGHCDRAGHTFRVFNDVGRFA